MYNGSPVMRVNIPKYLNIKVLNEEDCYFNYARTTNFVAK